MHFSEEDPEVVSQQRSCKQDAAPDGQYSYSYDENHVTDALAAFQRR